MKPDSMVYFIQAESGPVKIGRTTDVARRLERLQCGSHEALRLLREIKGAARLERWMHKRYRHLRIRGEWFSFSPDMVTVDPPDLPDPVSRTRATLKALIRERGHTYQSLGDEIGVTLQAIAEIVAGRTTGATQRFALAKALDVEVEDIWPETPVSYEIKAIRLTRGWTQREVAGRLDWNPETYRQKEVGMIGITGPELAQIARMYGVPIREAFPSWEPTEGEKILMTALGPQP